jgi:DNA-binding PadR family transcriptional regulator
MGFGGPGGPGGPGPFGRGSRARRGDVRTALLTLLAEEPRNGYQLMQEIERRSEGVWRPSPGSVYPALQQLEDEGLVRAEETDGRKLFHLTEDGRAAAEASAGEGAPWDAASDSVDSDVWELFGVARQVGMAIFQIAQAGTADQLTAAREILTNARRALYGILAEDDTAPEDDTSPETPPQQA